VPELALEAELHERPVQLRQINLPWHHWRRGQENQQLLPAVHGLNRVGFHLSCPPRYRTAGPAEV
jgi:hypothetical protein